MNTITRTQNPTQLTLVVVEPQESPAMALYPPIEGVATNQYMVNVDIVKDGNMWRWVRRMRGDIFDCYSSESFATAGEAACSAVRIARCHGVGVSADVEAVIARERRVGDEIAFWGQSITRCSNDAQLHGYIYCQRTAYDVAAEDDQTAVDEPMPWEYEDEREPYMVEVMPGRYAYTRSI